MGIRAVWKRTLALCAVAALCFAPPGRCEGTETFLWEQWFGSRQARADQRLMPGGAAIGVSVATQGVMVIGISRLEDGNSPAQAAGLQVGDIIQQVDGKTVESAQALQEIMGRGQEALLQVLRGREKLEVRLKPALSSDGMYRMGVWVQDGAVGIGTLTFYDPQTGEYGALGHAICDGDSGSLIPIQGGDLVDARIQGVRRSETGNPGELLGTLTDERLGSVEKNTPSGVFGKMETNYVNPLYPQGMQILPMDQVREGPARILSTVNGGGVKEYACEILSVRRQDQADTRGLLIQVTDEALRRVTGGIVQGMSGSPIIQEGKLVGAVTHVLVNDPTMGYGIFIENMLDAAS